VGTAHFFPYSFKASLSRLIREAAAVLFEGPLDPKSLAAIRASGISEEPAPHVLDALDRTTFNKIGEKVFPHCRRKTLEDAIALTVPDARHPLYPLTEKMKPWLTFFTVWSAYLERNGWRHSVDMEAYEAARTMDKQVIPMESVEEQVAVLEALSLERIVDFFNRVDHWDKYRRRYAQSFLEADLEWILSSATGFPSRHRTVIDGRDETFYHRMRPYLEEGAVVVCVGVPHVPGIGRFLEKDGFHIQGPPLPPRRSPGEGMPGTSRT
jgi:hypothetical protein